MQPDTPAVPSPIGVYQEGDRVEGDFKGKGVWCPGAITCNRYTRAYAHVEAHRDAQAHIVTYTDSLIDTHTAMMLCQYLTD
jgi:hypothetical protein